MRCSVQSARSLWPTNKAQAMYVLRDTEGRSRNHFCCGKATGITNSECVSVVLFIRHAKRMRSTISSSVACLDLPYFRNLSQKRHDFLKEKFLNIKCVF